MKNLEPKIKKIGAVVIPSSSVIFSALMKLMLIALILIFSTFSTFAFSIECLKETAIGSYKPKYAKNFAITYYKNFTLLKTGPKNDELLVANGHVNCTTTLPIFKNDARRIVATSTTHLPILAFFELEGRLVAFQGTNYISNKKFNVSAVTNINYQLNAEELIKLKADIVFAYAANIPFWKTVKDYQQLNIPVILIWDFLETHPLARAEWVVLQAHLVGKSKEAIVHFEKMEKDYNAIKNGVKAEAKKRALVGDIQNGKWVTCGGRSDLAQLIGDAGGMLVLANDKAETQFIALEKVFSLINKNRPDVWLPQNNWQNKKPLAADSRYKHFDQIPIFNNNKLVNASGFNDYWESGVARPDLVLKDLVSILHSKQPNEENLNWFKRIK